MDDFMTKMSQIEWTYGDKDRAALAILEKRITDAGRNGNPIIYSDLVQGVLFHLPNVNKNQPYEIKTFNWTGLDRKIMGDFLGYASYCSYRKHGFMVSALVVNRNEFQPSWHFFSWMKDLDVLADLEEDTVLRFWIEEVNKALAWFKANPRKRL